MQVAHIQQQYSELQDYVGWTPADVEHIQAAAVHVLPHISEIVTDFYDTLLKHPAAASVITGGPEQVARLKGTLALWIEQLFAGPYDGLYVERRAKVGLRHVEVGLAQVYTCVAMARMRSIMTSILLREWKGLAADRGTVVAALNRLLDLDLAMITAVYEAERREREKALLRTRLEGALKREKEFAESLLNHAPAAVLILDTAGKVLRFNPYFEQLSGYRIEDVEGREWLETFLAPEDRAAAHAALIVPLFQKKQQTCGERTATVVTRSQMQRTVRWSSTALTGPTGDAYALLLVGLDVTDLLEAQEQVLQSARLATIGQVMAGLAHESRNALQRIQAAAEMLELEVSQQPDALQYVERIEQAQRHLHRLFDEVRGYAGPIHLDCNPCRIDYIWREAWELLGAQREGRDATLIAPEGVGFEVSCDHFRMVQVFRNIFENALAACPEAVRIEIECAVTGSDGQRLVEVRVRDNGPGIAPAARAKIFDPFFTTKSKGTGLGMAIAQRVLEAHGGKIELGAGGSGAEFVVTLPLESA